MSPTDTPGAASLTSDEPPGLNEAPTLVPIPFSAKTFNSAPASLIPLVADQRAMSRLLERILVESGVSIAEMSRRLGISANSLRQYFGGRRSNPSAVLLVKIAEAAGFKVSINLSK